MWNCLGVFFAMGDVFTFLFFVLLWGLFFFFSFLTASVRDKFIDNIWNGGSWAVIILQWLGPITQTKAFCQRDTSLKQFAQFRYTI